MGLQVGGDAGQCPMAERYSETLVRLPLFYDLSEGEQDAVVRGVHEALMETIYSGE